MNAVNVDLIYPMVAMYTLTIMMLMKMFIARVRALKSGQLKVNDFKLYTNPGPDAVVQTARHYANLFEMPVLFYVACILGLILNLTSFAFVILAWAYVLARVIHSYVHTGNNRVILRMRLFTLSFVILSAMWIMILVRALSISALSFNV